MVITPILWDYICINNLFSLTSFVQESLFVYPHSYWFQSICILTMIKFLILLNFIISNNLTSVTRTPWVYVEQKQNKNMCKDLPYVLKKIVVTSANKLPQTVEEKLQYNIQMHDI